MRLGSFAGPVWRILFATEAVRALDPVRSPEGRFHHGGQRAIYASLSREGAGVAIARYVGPGDPPRVVAKLSVKLERVADLRGQSAASVVWQESRASGHAAPTWRFSDAARAAGAQAMLYSSRSRPELSHIVLFDWHESGALCPDGPPAPWP